MQEIKKHTKDIVLFLKKFVWQLKKHVIRIQLILNSKNSVKKLWKTFSPMINPSKIKRTEEIKKLVVDNNTITEGPKITNTFNSYFCEVGKSLAANVKEVKTSFHNYLKNKNSENMFLYPAASTEILDTISSFANEQSYRRFGHSYQTIKNNQIGT